MRQATTWLHVSCHSTTAWDHEYGHDYGIPKKQKGEPWSIITFTVFAYVTGATVPLTRAGHIDKL